MDGLLIGRFQPFHLGHVDAIHFALKRVERLFLGIGSSDNAREPENPFLAGERLEMIQGSLPDEILPRISTYMIPDFDDHRRWMEAVSGTVPPFGIIFTNDPMTARMYGAAGIRTSEIPLSDRESLSGTHIRDLVRDEEEWRHLVPPGTAKVLDRVGAQDIISGLSSFK